MGQLTLACREVDGSVTPPIAVIDYRETGWYERTAGVVDMPADRALTDDELALVAARPLALVASRPKLGLRRVVIEETPVHVRADAFVARLDPEDPWVVRFYVTDRGNPMPNAQVNLRVSLPVDPSTGAVPPGTAQRYPAEGLTFPASVTTDDQGIAEVTLVAGDSALGPVRAPVDGQVYSVFYHVDGVAAVNPSNCLSVLVWNAFGADNPAPTTWGTGIGTIFRAYGNLYPAMTNSVHLDLAVRANVLDRSQDIADRLELPITDPQYMPVTRDLSGAKMRAMRDWLHNPVEDPAPDEGVAAQAEPPTPPAPLPLAPDADLDAELGGKTLFARRPIPGPDLKA